MQRIIALYNEYKKTVMAVIGALGITASVVSKALHDHQVTPDQWATVGFAWATVLAVYQARNNKPYKE